MKLLSLVLFVVIGLINTSAFAHPTVGDMATYDVKQMIAGQTISAVMVNTITRISGDQVTVSSTINGQASPDETRSAEDLEGLFNLIDQCAAAGGSNETVSAANAAIPTCKMHQDLDNESGKVSADIWFGKVPFGIVKSVVNQESAAGTSTQTMLLKSYKLQK